MIPFHVVIPVRFSSTRLPGKALKDIQGKTLIQRVYEQALLSEATSVLVATDDERIEQHIQSLGGNVCLTASSHPSGTDRIAEAVEKKGYNEDAIVVNVQGDEPFISPRLIQQVARELEKHSKADMATLCEPFTKISDIFNPNHVKVVRDEQHYARYFSRAPIPWDRDEFTKEIPQIQDDAYFRHIGMYAFRAGFLKEFVSWPSSPIEKIEKLEQLRVLWYQRNIIVPTACVPALSDVNTEEDLIQARNVSEAEK